MHVGEILMRGLAQLAVVCYLLRVLADIGGLASPKNALCWQRRDLDPRLHGTLAARGGGLSIRSSLEPSRGSSPNRRANPKTSPAGLGAAAFTSIMCSQCSGCGLSSAFGGGVSIPLRKPRQSFGPSTQSSRFMMFNATVVFGPVYWRFFGLGFAGLAITDGDHSLSGSKPRTKNHLRAGLYSLFSKRALSYSSSNCLSAIGHFFVVLDLLGDFQFPAHTGGTGRNPNPTRA